MVLWEMTAITAYFLGLKRSYRLALRIQRRLIAPNHPKIRQFVYRRTREVFNVAVTVHKNIQQRDIEVGRNLGNMILRWLDRMKPSAQIRPRPNPPNGSAERIRHLPTTSKTDGTQKPTSKTASHDSSGKLLFSPLNFRPKSFPVPPPMMMQSTKARAISQCRRISYSSYPFITVKRKDMLEGVFRKDIAQLMV